jgi:hypothetical protein
VRAAKGELLELGEEPVQLCRALDQRAVLSWDRAPP